MNNDLELFSEERLIELLAVAETVHTSVELFNVKEMIPILRIALAAKQAKPVCYADHADIERIKSGSTTRIGSYQTNVMSIALYTIPQPAHTEQDGWKLVPVEPTEAMKAAAEGEYSLKLAYKAMLRAAPKPESE